LKTPDDNKQNLKHLINIVLIKSLSNAFI